MAGHDAVRAVALSLVLSLLLPAEGAAQEGPMSGAATLVRQPFSGSRNVAEQSGGPAYVDGADLHAMLAGHGFTVRPAWIAGLTADEDREYGEWHRLGLANGHLARAVAEASRSGDFVVGLLANCNGLLGMLGGLQQSGQGSRPLRVGLVWIDAHGDFNTPETTLSGMLGGMPVAVAAGLCLTRLRQESGLDPALAPTYITMACLRDVDPLEQELIDRNDLARLTVADIQAASSRLHEEMQRLSGITDVIYIHIDMDVLDPAEVPGHGLNVPGGPTSDELGEALTVMFSYPKCAAIGIASTPWGDDDPDGLSRRAAHRLIEGAMKGVAGRRQPAQNRGK